MNTTAKYLLIGLGVAAVGTGAYFYFRSKKDDSVVDAFTEDLQSGEKPSLPSPAKPNAPSAPRPKPQSSSFPLKYGSKGSLVKDLQAALIKRYGATLMPKYGADGQWGKELNDALISKGIPTFIEKDLFDKIATGKFPEGQKPSGGKTNEKSPEVDSPTIAKKLHRALKEKDIFVALDALKAIYDVNKYIKVNEHFKKTDVAGWGISMSMVTAVLRVFPANDDKLEAQFKRIGLKKRGDQWNLSGLATLAGSLTTIEPTKVWDFSGKSLTVPASTALGTYRRAANGITEFQTIDGRLLFVNTKSISYRHD